MVTKWCATCSETLILLLGSMSRPSSLAFTLFHTLTAYEFLSWTAEIEQSVCSDEVSNVTHLHRNLCRHWNTISFAKGRYAPSLQLLLNISTETVILTLRKGTNALLTSGCCIHITYLWNLLLFQKHQFPKIVRRVKEEYLVLFWGLVQPSWGWGWDLYCSLEYWAGYRSGFPGCVGEPCVHSGTSSLAGFSPHCIWQLNEKHNKYTHVCTCHMSCVHLTGCTLTIKFVACYNIDWLQATVRRCTCGGYTCCKAGLCCRNRTGALSVSVGHQWGGKAHQAVIDAVGINGCMH